MFESKFSFEEKIEFQGKVYIVQANGISLTFIASPQPLSFEGEGRTLKRMRRIVISNL